MGQVNRFGSPNNLHGGNASAMEKNYNNSSASGQRQLLGGLPPSGKIPAQQSGTKNKGFKSAQRSTNFQRVGNSISGSNAVNQTPQTGQNGHGALLNQGRFSHHASDEYKNLSEDLGQQNSGNPNNSSNLPTQYSSGSRFGKMHSRGQPAVGNGIVGANQS